MPLGGCTTVGNVTVCRPPRIVYRAITYCPTCRGRRRTVVRLALWYDPVVTCCGCGDSWAGGELVERPFMRGWRKQAVERAVRDWADAVPKRDALRMLHQELNDTVA
jgi:hypothetical protein